RVQRLKVRQPRRLFVTNVSETTIATVDVLLSSGYVQSFADVALTRGPADVTDAYYVFEGTALESGDTAVIARDMQPQAYWHRPGTAGWRVLDDSGNETGSGEVAFATMVWP